MTVSGKQWLESLQLMSYISEGCWETEEEAEDYAKGCWCNFVIFKHPRSRWFEVFTEPIDDDYGL